MVLPTVPLLLCMVLQLLKVGRCAGRHCYVGPPPELPIQFAIESVLHVPHFSSLQICASLYFKSQIYVKFFHFECDYSLQPDNCSHCSYLINNISKYMGNAQRSSATTPSIISAALLTSFMAGITLSL